MLLKDLLKNIDYEVIQGNLNIDILNISADSRTVNDNSLFVCIKGEKIDGHKFINQITNVKAIITDEIVDIPNDKQTFIKVNNTRSIFPYIMSNFYHNIENDLNIIGITGTNGKTSTTIIIDSIFKYINIKTAILGTINNRIGEDLIPIKITTSTTPDIKELFEIFNYIKEQKINNIIMEVTSHALALNRVETIKFEVGVFTNLTQDHLDYHKTMEAYKEAKFKLFLQSKSAVVNIDDECGKDFFKRIDTPKLSFAINNKTANLYAYNIKLTADGSYFDLKYNNIEYKNIFINLVGKFSIYNVLGGIGACLFRNIKIKDIINALGNIHKISGRCEKVNIDADFAVIVDYAHSPDALENILKTAREFTKNKLISVFGCGGNRDNTKRPIMGKISIDLADFTIITSDNPRDEEPKSITDEIEKDILNYKNNYTIILDREKAIEYAIKSAKSGDVIVIAGKGHECYQEFKNKEQVHFSDIEEVKKKYNKK